MLWVREKLDRLHKVCQPSVPKPQHSALTCVHGSHAAGPTTRIPSAIQKFFTAAQVDALRWCRLAERGLNSRVTDSMFPVTVGTRFWGNYFGGPDVSHPFTNTAYESADVAGSSPYRTTIRQVHKYMLFCCHPKQLVCMIMWPVSAECSSWATAMDARAPCA